MKNCRERIHSARSQSGAASVEYAIVVAVVAGVVFLALSEFDLRDAFTAMSNHVKALIP